jgi:hypothetical protein
MIYYKAIQNERPLGKGLKTVLNELFTIKEVEKMNLNNKFIKDNFIKVEINKNRTYFFFGARFESKLK